MTIKIKKINNNAKIPFYAHLGDAGMDLYSTETIDLLPENIQLCKTGVAMEIPDGNFGLIKERSSLGKIGIIVPGGVIDSGYRGEIIVMLYNHGKNMIKINAGERIAQLIIIPVASPELVEVRELNNSKRGDGGFGSTGK